MKLYIAEWQVTVSGEEAQIMSDAPGKWVELHHEQRTLDNEAPKKKEYQTAWSFAPLGCVCTFPLG